MPAWITSLLRDDVTVPIPSAASSTTTSRPACASCRAIARPITPAPITTHSTLSIPSTQRQSHVFYRLVGDDVVRRCAEKISARFPDRTLGNEALIMSGHLP